MERIAKCFPWITRQVMDDGGNNDTPGGNSGNADEARRIATWSALATHMTPSIQRVVEFAKRVPGKISVRLNLQQVMAFIKYWFL